MATRITEVCVNCGACEPECPNTAIYEGGTGYQLDEREHPPLIEGFFYIVPEKCTECVGFYDREQCALVCPVDCCVTDPDHAEDEPTLVARAKHLHPSVEFKEPIRSRYRSQ